MFSKPSKKGYSNLKKKWNKNQESSSDESDGEAVGPQVQTKYLGAGNGKLSKADEKIRQEKQREIYEDLKVTGKSLLE